MASDKFRTEALRPLRRLIIAGNLMAFQIAEGLPASETAKAWDDAIKELQASGLVDMLAPQYAAANSRADMGEVRA